MTSLYNKYRPKRLEDVLGQPDAVRVIKTWLETKTTPHAIMLTGPSGVGKTTIGRILKRKLGCRDRMDYIEQNCADLRGIDDIRALQRRCRPKPISKCRVTLLDECHQLPSISQNGLLKMLEDTPNWCYFILCTTDPQKMLRTVQTRCSILKLMPVGDDELQKLVKSVCRLEKKKLNSDVTDRLISCAEGSPRKALVLLEAVINLRSESEQLDSIEKSDPRHESIEIARLLISPRTRWDDLAKVLKNCDLSEPESLRHLVMNYAASVMLNNPRLAPRAARIIDVFRDNLFDAKKSGFLLYCYQIVAKK